MITTPYSQEMEKKKKKLKGKNVVNTAISKSIATLAPGMFKVDIEPISARLKNNRDAHEVYIEKTIEYADTLRGFVECARTQYPSKPLLESTCMFTKHLQELLVYASQTCPNSPKPSEKLVAVTPSKKDKRLRFAEPVTSSNNIPKQTDSLKTKDSNKPLLTSTRVKPTTSASGSKPSGNTKNNRITRPPHSNQKNKVEDHPRKVKSGLNKMNSVSEPISNALVKHSMRNAKFESICAIYNICLFDANHDMCLVDFVNDVNVVPDRPLVSGLACALGKSKKSSHQPKAEDTNQEKLYLLYMDLCGLMRVESMICTDKSKITRKQSKASKHGHENQKSAKPKPQKTKALANFHLQGPILLSSKVLYNLKRGNEREGPNVLTSQTPTVLTVEKEAGTTFTIHPSSSFYPHGKTRGKSKLEGD
ncbi:hypothetical protein Tco_0796095 [Tanacetum coccineum]